MKIFWTLCLVLFSLSATAETYSYQCKKATLYSRGEKIGFADAMHIYINLDKNQMQVSGIFSVNDKDFDLNFKSSITKTVESEFISFYSGDTNNGFVMSVSFESMTKISISDFRIYAFCNPVLY